MSTIKKTNRREFLNNTFAGAAAFSILPSHVLGGPKNTPPSEVVNVAIIGAGGQGLVNVRELLREDHAQIVAVADPTAEMSYANFYYKSVAGRRPVAAHINRDNEKRGRKGRVCAEYIDFREMLEKQGKDIDAVLIATPDHVHAVAATTAMKMGKHVYCEKPLGQNIHEVRVTTEVAREQGVATQLGTITHASQNYRRVVERIQSGTIGDVREVHIWCDDGWAPANRPKDTPPVPEWLDWDLWLGPAPYRPYHPRYVPVTWRSWWGFGNGRLGDMGCHFIDLPFWALDLKYPLTVEAEGPPVHPDGPPRWLISRWEFPARGKQPPVTLTWYDGDKRPPLLKEKNLPDWKQGVLFVGSDGMLVADYGRRELYPKQKFADIESPPQTIPNSPGHKTEWLAACKGGVPALCNLDYTGPLTETVLLGSTAYRAGQKLEWDALNLKAVNCPEADAFIRREYRKGWEL